MVNFSSSSDPEAGSLCRTAAEGNAMGTFTACTADATTALSMCAADELPYYNMFDTMAGSVSAGGGANCPSYAKFFGGMGLSIFWGNLCARISTVLFCVSHANHACPSAMPTMHVHVRTTTRATATATRTTTTANGNTAK